MSNLVFRGIIYICKYSLLYILERDKTYKWYVIMHLYLKFQAQIYKCNIFI